MDRKIVPFKRWHIEWLQSRTGVTEGFVFDEAVSASLEGQNSWTAVLDGEVLACGGTIQHWPGRHMAWTHLGPQTAPHMLWLTRAVKEKLQGVKGRIEMNVRCGFEQGHRWAGLLGFTVETPVMVAWGPQGEDHSGYVRINR